MSRIHYVSKTPIFAAHPTMRVVIVGLGILFLLHPEQRSPNVILKVINNRKNSYTNEYKTS